MSKRKLRGMRRAAVYDRKQVRQDVSKRLTKLFFLQLAVGTLAVIALFLGAYLYSDHRIWYTDDFFYPLVHSVHTHWSTYFLVCILALVVLLACWHFLRVARLLAGVVDAVDSISREEETVVSLPGELHEMELQLNQMVANARRDRQEAKEAEQRKNDLIVYMAHDLKTPLTSVIGYLTLLSGEPDVKAELREKYLDIALRKAERLEDLINEFFEITRFNLSKMELETSRINLSMLIGQIFSEYQPVLAERGLTCEMDLASGLTVVCDADKMERVFDNLLRNAGNYSYENSVITVRASRTEDGFARVRMTNRGKTIPPEKLARIFEQFYRVESSRTSKTGGAGLGLAIAREIVTLHGGTLTCESADETVTFTMKIPMEAEQKEKDGKP